VRESQELQIHHQAVVEEKLALTGKWRQTQYQLEKEKEQLNLLQDKLEKAAQFTSELSNQVAHWQQQCAQDKREAALSLATQVEKTEQREETILDLQRQVGLLRHEGEKARDELAGLSTANAEKERNLTEAQQHLARKVKEVTELEIHFEAKERQTEELQQIHTQDKIKIAELQANCDMLGQQQRRLEEQLHEAIKAYENLQAKWEDKYLSMHEKWQQAESRVKELEKLEERYNQLQGLFANAGNVFNVSAAPPKTPSEPLPKLAPRQQNLL
jgi:predicted  nucleic acid-binding Zn-ribbon protein